MKLNDIKNHLPAFEKWLKSKGVQILTPTNEWEVLRFLCAQGTSIIYKDAKDNLKLMGRSLDAYTCFKKGFKWNAGVSSKRVSGVNRKFVGALIKRDGDKCFYCDQVMIVGDITVEHLIPISSGGSNHISNMALAHKECNQKAGHLSVMEKIKLREKMKAC